MQLEQIFVYQWVNNIISTSDEMYTLFIPRISAYNYNTKLTSSSEDLYISIEILCMAVFPLFFISYCSYDYFNIMTEIELLCFYCFWVAHADAFFCHWLKLKCYPIISPNTAVFISLWVFIIMWFTKKCDSDPCNTVFTPF
jgi:hypothetical protein